MIPPILRSLNKLKNRIKPDLLITIGAFFLFLATAAYYNIPTPEFLNTKFGWEYGNIAESLVQGTGFANAFTPQSGPTAWMPPLFVFFLAGVFKVFGVKSVASMWVVLIVKYAAMAGCCFILLRLLSYTGYQKYKLVWFAIFLGLIYINLGTFFRAIHDEWLILSLICVSVYALIANTTSSTRGTKFLLFILAFFLPLANPILAMAFLVTSIGSLYLGLRQTSPRYSAWLSIGSLLFLYLLSNFIWTYRNFHVFRTVIPVKSNFWFDFYQANVIDEDGLITNATFEVYHPIHPNEIRKQYIRDQERKFTESYKNLSFAWIPLHPLQFSQNVGRRFVSAFVYMHQSDDVLLANHPLFSTNDLEKLNNEYLTSTNQPPYVHWVSLALTPEEAQEKFRELDLENEAAIFQNWLDQHNNLKKRYDQIHFVARSLAISLLPFLCMITGLLIEKVRRNPVYALSVVLYVLYLTPYILVTHYRRYQVPLIGLQSLFIFLVAGIVLDIILPQTKALLKDRKGTAS